MFNLLKLLHTNKRETGVLLQLSGAFLIGFVIYLIASHYIIRALSLKDIQQYLKTTALSVSEDFAYSNGTWNTDKYLSDVNTPSEVPLYIYSLDGFLIDRLNIIHGFLDTSNFDYASSFNTPTTIISPIGEHWRVFSYFIERNSQRKGVILLGYFDPASRSEKELDEILLINAQRLDNEITLSDGQLNTTRVIDKEVDPNISFEVVDTFNRSHKSVGGPPAYIDKSYLQDLIGYKDFTVISDPSSQKKYMFYVQPILAEDEMVGIVALGKGLDQLEQILRNQFVLSLIVGLLSVTIFILLTAYIYRHDIKEIIQEKITLLSNPVLVEVDRINFNLSESKIVINGVHSIEIPADSYQYDICKLLFKNPRKRYDTFDLSDAIGELDEQKNVKRLVYDAVNAINGKVRKMIGIKFISHKDKKYYLNPILSSKLS